MIRKILILILSSTLILILYIFGTYELSKNNNFLKTVKEKINVKIISPNFELEYGLSSSDIEERFRKLIRYSDPDKKKQTLFIWPEGVFSGYSYREIIIFKELIEEKFSKKHNIIFGANKLDLKTGRFYNSMLLVNNNFEIIQSYNKRKLVPFGEFLPFENFFNKFGFKKITEGHSSFLKGQKDNNLFIDELKILPLICYEIIFTDLILKRVKSFQRSIRRIIFC